MDAFINGMDSAGMPLNNVDSDGEILRFSVKNGVWQLDSSSRLGDGSTSAWYGANDSGYDFCVFMVDTIAEFENCMVEVAIKPGECIGVAVIEGGNGHYPATKISNWESGTFDFTGKQPGFMSDGTIIGTFPELYFPGEL